MQDLAARKIQITKLLRGWLSMVGNIDMGTIDAFVDATRDVTLDAVTKAVEQFASGRVERNNSFPPAAAEFAANAREWQAAIDKRAGQDGPEMHNGLIEMDFGAGRIDMRGLTNAEQDQIIANKGCAPNGRSLAYMSLPEIKAALEQKDMAQVEGGATFAAPRLGRM